MFDHIVPSSQSAELRRRRRWSLWFVSLVLLTGLVFYVPLLKGFTPRRQAFSFFFELLLFRAATHLLLLLIVCIRAKVTVVSSQGIAASTSGACFDLKLTVGLRNLGPVVFWGLSLIGLLLVGGLKITLPFLGLGLGALGLTLLGRQIASFIMPKNLVGWGMSLGFGIVAASLLGAALSALHALQSWVVGAIFLGALVSTMWACFRSQNIKGSFGWSDIPQWSAPQLLAFEGVFLTLLFLLVAGSPPESKSDAIRIYWPYVKLMQENHGFFDLPFHFSYIIPQAGLSYAACILLLLGPTAVRWAMLLPWLALVGIVGRNELRAVDENGQNRISSGSRAALALVVASCPILLSVTSSLMQDTFVCLTGVLLALVCVHGKDPSGAKFWGIVGLMVGFAWTAKFTLVAYAAPLTLWAIYRGWRAGSSWSLIRGVPLGALTAALTASPWLWHSYRQSGNPFFPYFLDFFPVQNWPTGLGKMNLDDFRLLGGLRGLLFWPIDMTYSTSKFVEGTDGYLGLVLLVLLAAAILPFWNGTANDRVLLITAILGTGLLWTQTAYVRYWLPGICILALASAPSVEYYGRSLTSAYRNWFCLLALVISLCHLPAAMINSWMDPKGWPWDFYSGKVDERSYISRNFPGFAKISKLAESWKGWPRVWNTNYEAIGHLNVMPLEAYLWEMSLHGAIDPRARIKYLGSAGCEYWVVDRDGEGARWLQVLGLDQFYWDDEHLLMSEGSAAVFRMKPYQEALKALDSRSKPNSQLLPDGGFENGVSSLRRQWVTLGTVEVADSNAEARDGQKFVVLAPGAQLHRVVPTAPGTRRIEASVWARTPSSDKRPLFRVEIGLLDSSEQTLSASGQNFRIPRDWTLAVVSAEVPERTAMVQVLLRHEEKADPPVHADEVRLRTVE